MPIVLETERLILRTWTLDDGDATLGIYTDPEVRRYLGPGLGSTRADAEAYLRRLIDRQERHGFGSWAVVEKQTGEVIGNCGLKPAEDPDEVELVCHLARAAWGRGYATEATRACVRHAFDTLHARRVVGLVEVGNDASERLLHRLGLRFEAIVHLDDCEAKRYVIEIPASA